jgi:ribosomal protein S18 acetylase RimI-like enzyme
MLEIKELKAPPSLELFSELVELLQDAVQGGASVGWLQTPSTKDARNYWTEVLEAVGRGERLLLVATDNHVCAGAVQVAMVHKPNARHRGEVQKLVVHSQYRRRGVGRTLLAAADKAAAARGLGLLVLDVRSDAGTEAFLKHCGYEFAGRIPGFVQVAGGGFEPTSIFYRRLAGGART